MLVHMVIEDGNGGLGSRIDTVEKDIFQFFKSFPTISINLFNSIINLCNCLYSGMQIKNYIETLDKNIQLRLEPKLLRIFDETSLLFTWWRRLLLYFAFYVVIICLHLYFKRFDWWLTDEDRFGAMLSLLITSEAALLAIVVSLSLVAVQLAASSYSARVIEVFRKAPDLLILMGVYGAAIFYGLWALNQTNSLEAHIAFSYYLGIFAFVALELYILNTFEMLKPSTVIKMLTGEVTVEKILAINEKTQGKPDDTDPIQPIIDIVNGSIMKYDYETERIGLKAIGDRTSLILKKKYDNNDKLKFTKHVLVHLDKVGKLTLTKKDLYFTFEVVKTLKKIAITFNEEKIDDVPFGIAYYFGEIGTAAAKKNLPDETSWVLFDLGEFGETAAKYELSETSLQSVIYLGIVGKIAAEKEVLDATAIDSLEKVGKAAAYLNRVPEEAIKSLMELINAYPFDKRFEKIISHAVKSIGEIGRGMVDQYVSWDDLPGKDTVKLIEYLNRRYGDWIKPENIEKIDGSMTVRVYIGKNSLSLILKDEKVYLEIDDSKVDEFIVKKENNKQKVFIGHNLDLSDTIEFLGVIGKKASEQNLDIIAAKAASSLQLIAVASSNDQLKWNVIEAQSEIGKISANRGLNATTWEAAMSIGILGMEVSDDQKLKSLEFLEEIGLLACKHGTKLDDAARQVVNSICRIGKTEVEPNKENEIVALKVISSLEKIGKVAEKNPDSVTRHTVGKLKEFESIISKDGKSTEIGREFF